LSALHLLNCGCLVPALCLNLRGHLPLAGEHIGLESAFALLLLELNFEWVFIGRLLSPLGVERVVDFFNRMSFLIPLRNLWLLSLELGVDMRLECAPLGLAVPLFFKPRTHLFFVLFAFLQEQIRSPYRALVFLTLVHLWNERVLNALSPVELRLLGMAIPVLVKVEEKCKETSMSFLERLFVFIKLWEKFAIWDVVHCKQEGFQLLSIHFFIAFGEGLPGILDQGCVLEANIPIGHQEFGKLIQRKMLAGKRGLDLRIDLVSYFLI